jgi:hypothetical protein
MRRVLYSLFFLFTVLGILCCEDRDATPIDLSEERNYFPLQKGNFAIYKIKEIKYSVIQGNTTREYFLKELIADSLLDGSNNYSYVIERYKKNTLAEESWNLDSVWTARIQGPQIIKVENNVPFVKLIFPVKNDISWNGNAYNIKGEETYSMDSVHRSKIINDFTFDSTLVVTHKNDSSSISQDYRAEIYAKGVGLIYKKSIITSNLQNNGAIVFPIQIDRGTDLTQTIIEYGKE